MNKKGFVLTETIIVTVFIVTIFTFVFSSVFPLIGTYEDLAEREENIDILYKLYNIRKMINNDSYKSELLKMDFKKLTCNDFSNVTYCNNLMNYLELNSFNLIYTDSILNNYDIIKNVNDEIGTYIDAYKDENKRTIILLDNKSHTIGHIDIYDDNTNAAHAIKNNILRATCDSTVTDTDGTIYFSGENSCIDFNYVWYSGKLWRITAIYPDGTLKMMTENAITSIPFGNNYVFYTSENQKSYAYQWLNEDFLLTLANYHNIITDSKKWNATAPSSANVTSKLSETNLVTAYVGLLDAYEYYMSYQKTGNANNGYLNYNNSRYKGSWFILHPYDPSLTSITTGKGLRPAVYLKDDVNFSGGDGTYDNPFTIEGDVAKGAVDDRINTRTSGEFVKFKNTSNALTYRIVSIEPSGGNIVTKVVANFYAVNQYTNKSIARGTYFGATTNSSLPNNYWDYYLNNSWYNLVISDTGSNLFTSGTYYLGVGNSSLCYKEAICNYCDPTIRVKNCAKTEPKTYNVGLLRFGEMFSAGLGTQTLEKVNNSYHKTWLITTYNSSSTFRFVNDYGETPVSDDGIYTNLMAAQPTLYLKASVKIKSGSGTLDDPYLVGL